MGLSHAQPSLLRPCRGSGQLQAGQGSRVSRGGGRQGRGPDACPQPGAEPRPLGTANTGLALSPSSVTAASFVWAGETPLAPARLPLAPLPSPPRTPLPAPPPSHVKHKLLVFTFKAFPSCSRQPERPTPASLSPWPLQHPLSQSWEPTVTPTPASQPQKNNSYPKIQASASRTKSHPNTRVSNLVPHQPSHPASSHRHLPGGCGTHGDAGQGQAGHVPSRSRHRLPPGPPAPRGGLRMGQFGDQGMVGSPQELRRGDPKDGRVDDVTG